jgi:phosphate transport system protein
MTDTRRSFHTQLEEIRDDIVRLGAIVVEALPHATEALLGSDLELAESVIADDAALDARAVLLEEKCYAALALQSPVAVDLRAVVAAVRMVAEIERSGDLAVNICKAARRIFPHQLDPRLRCLINSLSERAHQEFRFAMDAYAEDDAALAGAIDDMDDLLDRTHNEFIQAIFESHQAGRLDLQVAVQLALVARFYERIGDHAVNIGLRVRYKVTGMLPESEPSNRGSRPSLAAAQAEAERRLDGPPPSEVTGGS